MVLNLWNTTTTEYIWLNQTVNDSFFNLTTLQNLTIGTRIVNINLTIDPINPTFLAMNCIFFIFNIVLLLYADKIRFKMLNLFNRIIKRKHENKIL